MLATAHAANDSASSSISTEIYRFIDERSGALPVFNEVASRLRKAVDGPGGAADLEAIIQTDQVLAAAVLRAANSSFYGGLTAIKTIRAAVTRLGIQQLLQIVFVVTEANRHEMKTASMKLFARMLWKHATSTAVSAQWLARRLDLAPLAEEAFLAGLVHDIGKLAIAAAIDSMESERGLQLEEAVVNEIMDSLHTSAGIRLLEAWSIPDPYLSIVKQMHDESGDEASPSLNLVRLADLASRKAGLGTSADSGVELIITPEAQALGATEIILAQLEIQLEDWAESLDTMMG